MAKLIVVRTITAVAIVLFSLSSFHAVAQISSTLEEGMKPYQTYEGGDIDSINMVNGTLALHIPLISYPQRGGKIHFGFSLQYHNTQLAPGIACMGVWVGTTLTCGPYVSNYGLYAPGYGQSSSPTGNQLLILPDLPVIYNASTSSPYQVVEPDNATHELVAPSSAPYYQRSNDTTGYQYLQTGNYGSFGTGFLWDRQGTKYSMANGAPTAITDVSGNTVGANGLSWTDTLGRSIPTFAAAQQTSDFGGCTGSIATSSAYLWTLPGPTGGTSQFKVCMAQFPLSYAVPGCTGTQTGAGLCTQTTSGTNLEIQSIVLPNSTAWTFEFNSNGDLYQITLPTGGSISYTWTYTTGGCVGTTQSPQAAGYSFPNYGRAVTSRTVTDQTGSHTWAYTLNSTTLSGGVTTTTVTDPNGNNTVHTATSLENPYDV
jgi:hypothetical protein